VGQASVQELSFCVHVQIEIPRCQEVVIVSTVPLKKDDALDTTALYREAEA
jgi:hypothetical protein